MYTASSGDAVLPRQRALIMCLPLALVGVWTEGMCVSMGAGAIVPTDLFTLNHMSNLILVSRLN